MKTEKALFIIGGSLSKPSKMPGWSIGLPAKECKTGHKLRDVKGSVCYDCYALKGCYVFKVVQQAQYRRLKAIRDPQWVEAMAHLINSKRPRVFRWHDSGDVQEHQWPGFTWAIGDGSRVRDQATSSKPQAASVKPQA